MNRCEGVLKTPGKVGAVSRIPRLEPLVLGNRGGWGSVCGELRRTKLLKPEEGGGLLITALLCWERLREGLLEFFTVSGGEKRDALHSRKEKTGLQKS